MAGSRSTTIVLVGHHPPAAADALTALGRLANVRATPLAASSEEYAKRWLAQSYAPYVAHDRDPLVHVASAWVEFFDDLATYGALNLEVNRALEAFDRGDLTMPDYYIVVAPESLPATWKHWWLGVLPQVAPARVIPWNENGPTSLARVLRTLPTSRQWPEPGPWLLGVEHAVPDRVGPAEPLGGGFSSGGLSSGGLSSDGLSSGGLSSDGLSSDE
ncbi:MAG: hypothetical protein JWM51_1881 [Microbacteriaceae bacterium]|nr:hypothetical protein [Microbacteriaceae bacterium]